MHLCADGWDRPAAAVHMQVCEEQHTQGASAHAMAVPQNSMIKAAAGRTCSQCSASIAAIHPDPAATIACTQLSVHGVQVQSKTASQPISFDCKRPS